MQLLSLVVNQLRMQPVGEWTLEFVRRLIFFSIIFFTTSTRTTWFVSACRFFFLVTFGLKWWPKSCILRAPRSEWASVHWPRVQNPEGSFCLFLCYSCSVPFPFSAGRLVNYWYPCDRTRSLIKLLFPCDHTRSLIKFLLSLSSSSCSPQTVISTQRHQQYPQCPSWFFILERYKFCGHRQWDRKTKAAK